MPFYQRMGSVPPKRHTQFRQPDGSLYREQVMGVRGFDGMQSILYHVHPPTQVTRIAPHRPFMLEAVPSDILSHRHLRTQNAPQTGDAIDGRQYLMFNSDVAIAVCRPTESMTYFYRNGTGDELLFIHEGEGHVETQFGLVPFRKGDYVVLPIGTTYRVVAAPQSALRLLVIEAQGSIEAPRRYLNEYGQFLEHSPYCERDIHPPQELVTHSDDPTLKNDAGEYEVRVKARGMLTAFFYDFHPLDVVGWDGLLYPYTFNIEDFEPITGRLHQPPPVHQTFKGANFVVCSFVPRLFDYHPLSIPAPYAHSNVDSDEVIYYVAGDFMSRKGVEISSFTIHPSGIPHGPQPGKAEASIGKERTDEYAVMVDTFRPLSLTPAALSMEDATYWASWQPPT